jgi:hypothetical protein
VSRIEQRRLMLLRVSWRGQHDDVSGFHETNHCDRVALIIETHEGYDSLAIAIAMCSLHKLCKAVDGEGKLLICDVLPTR